MRTLLGMTLAVAATCAAVDAAADVDVYGNEIQYESDGVTVKYRFWHSVQTAEAASLAVSASGFASPSGDFEPRCSTWAASDGKCCTRGLYIVVR